MNGFQEPQTRARAAEIALMLWMGASLLFGGSAIYSLVSIAAYQSGESGNWVDLDQVDLVSTATGLLYTVLYLACAVLVGRWIYRVNNNAWHMSAGMRVSPGMNVGSFFIPFLNLIRPFTGVRETWQASHRPSDPEAVPVPGVMRLWWAAWLIAGALGQLSFRMGLAAKTLDDFSQVAWVDLAGTPIDLVAGAALIWIIRRLTAVQGQFQDHELFQ